MRRIALTLAIATTLALTACVAEDSSPGAEPSAALTGPACDETFRASMAATGAFTEYCWTAGGNAPSEVVVAGDHIFTLGEQSTATSDGIVARNARDGSVAWESAPIEGFTEFPSAPRLTIFGEGDDAAVVVGYHVAGAFHIDAYNAATGDPEFSSVQELGGTGRVTWGHDAVAAVDDGGSAYVLTGDSQTFSPVTPLEWPASVGVAPSPAIGDPVERVLYATSDRLVLDFGATPDGSQAGIRVVDHAGAPVALLAAADMPAGNLGPDVTFAGGHALVQGAGEANAHWFDLEDGSAVDWPLLPVGRTMATGAPESGDQSFGLAPILVSPGGDSILVNGRMGLTEGLSQPVAPDVSALALSDARAYSTGGALDLKTWTASDLEIPQEYTVEGVAETPEGTMVIYSGLFGVGAITED